LSQVLVFAALDESGSLTADTEWFTMALLATAEPEALRNIIPRAALRSGKRTRRQRKLAAELKWRNASQRIRQKVLADLGQANVELFALTIQKRGRRIADTPLNYTVLACELLQLCWHSHPNIALSLDRHFTSPTQRAVVDTFIHRHWPEQGILTVQHVDSQNNHMVQLADFVAGSVHDWHKRGDETKRLLDGRFKADLMEDWALVKRKWLG
jgi:hypothetical protein